MPTGIVKLQDNDAIVTSPGLSREGGEQFGKERLVDSVREIPHRLAARRRDETGYVEPFVAMVTERDRISAPLKKMTAEVQQFQKMVKGTHVQGQRRGSFATGTRSKS